MAYDETLAERIRGVLPVGDMREQKMFGGLAFMLDGHMLCGVVGDTLMLRLGPEGADRAQQRPHVRPMDFTGRTMKAMVYVDPPGLRGASLRRWVADAAAFVATLPVKTASASRNSKTC